MEEVEEIRQVNVIEDIVTAKKPVEQDNVDKDDTEDKEEPETVEKSILEVVEKQVQEQEETHVEDEGRIITFRNNEVAEEVGEMQPESSKKPKHSPRQGTRFKPTILQPFSLATEKRSRERRASVDFSSVSDKKPVQAGDFKESRDRRLNRSSSLNFREKTLSLNASGKVRENCGEKVSGVAPRNLSRSKVATTESTDEQTERQPAEELSKKSRLHKNSMFKASTLPNANGAKHLQSKPDDKRWQHAAATHTKSAPRGGTVGKSTAMVGSGNKKTEDKCKNSSVSRTISSSAKDTLSKLFKPTRRALAVPK